MKRTMEKLGISIDDIVKEINIKLEQRDKEIKHKLEHLSKFIASFPSFDDYMKNMIHRNQLYLLYIKPHDKCAFLKENYTEEYSLIFNYVLEQEETIIVTDYEEIEALTDGNPFVHKVLKYKGYLFYWMHGQGSIPIIEQEKS